MYGDDVFRFIAMYTHKCSSQWAISKARRTHILHIKYIYIYTPKKGKYQNVSPNQPKEKEKKKEEEKEQKMPLPQVYLLEVSCVLI